MSERKRKRGRPRSTPILSYSSEMKMRNSIARVIKKPRYLLDQEDESNHNHSRSSCSPSSRLSQYSGYDNKGGGSNSQTAGGNDKSRNKRGYNPDFDDKDSEYLYGSDFELDDEGGSDEKEDILDSGSASEDIGNEVEEEDMLQFSDGETSMSSFSTVSESQSRMGFGSRPQTPVPVWLQDREYPPLELPHSADDLLLPRAYVLKAVGIYEVLRHFRTLVRLSPVRFEDFCAALMVDEQSNLLAEIHMALLKALIREEDSQQTHFGPLDQKDSINVILYFIDPLSWPESLRLYLQSDKEFSPTLRILNSCNYPYTSLVNRLHVLQFLCDQFLQTSVVREDLLSEGKLRYDDHCRACHKTGDLLCCDSCSAVYHLDCVDPPLQDIPGEMEDWTCSVCTAHQVDGVTDCISPMETSGNLCRQDPLGFDRHGRKYWFLVRRLFIESEDGEIWYYSTQAQLEEIRSLLDVADLEEELCCTLNEIFSELKRHMSVTETLTSDNKGNRKSCVEIENDMVTKRTEERKLKQLKQEQENADKLIEEIKEEEGEVKEEPVDASDKSTDKEGDQIKEEPEEKKSDNNHVSKLDPVTGELLGSPKAGKKINKKPDVKDEKSAGDEKGDTSKSSDDNKDKVKKEIDDISLQTEVKIKMAQMNTVAKWYRLGCDGKYKSYVNQYSSNPLALNKLQHNEERDRKRHLSHKFSLTQAAEFKWSGVMYGNKESLVSTLRHTLLSLEQTISSHLFHPHWSNVRKLWNVAVMKASEPASFTKVLMWFVAAVKPVVFNTVWHESLGHVRFNRVTALDREEKKKQEKKEKKEPEQEEMRPMTIVKYTLGLKHQVWKLKGEEYRMHALWGWQWASSLRRSKHVPMSTVGLRAGPDKYMVPIKGSGGLRSLSVNPNIFKQLTLKTPSLKPTLLSPNQLAAEAAKNEAATEEKKNEIIIASSSGQQKVEVGMVKLEDMFQDGLVNVSQALNSKFRFVYPKVAKTSVLDCLLNRRLMLAKQEEKDLANKKLQGSDSKPEDEEDEIDVENDDSDATLSDNSDHENIEELPDSQRSTIHKQRPAGNLLKEIRTLKIKYEAIDDFDGNYTCYSVICRSSDRCHCYSPTCLQKRRTRDKLLSSVKNYRIVTSKPSPFDEVGAHSPVRLTEADTGSTVTKVETVSESVTTTTTSTVTSVNGRVVNSSVSSSVELAQVKSENTDSSDGRSSRASSEIKIRMDDTDETSQGSMSNESKFSVKNNKTYSSQSTSGKVYLKKLSSEAKRTKKILQRIPVLSLFKVRQKSSKNMRPGSLMILPKWEARMLARKGGRYYIQGFNHNAKANNTVWPYPCSRPVFKTVWQYRTSIMPTLNSVAMQLRILWVCLRWDDMNEKGPGDGRKQITTDVEIVQTEILKRKHFGRYLEKTEYLRRKVTIPFDVPKPVREFTPSQRSGLRKRRRALSPVNKEPQSVEEWVEEERLDIWEIRFFGERLEKAATISKKSVGERGECIQTVTSRGSSPAEIRARMEEQLKIQRANFNQKKALESTPPAKGGIVRLSITSGGTITTGSGAKLTIPANPNATTKVVQAGASTIMALGGQLSSSLSGRKIVATKDGRIITVQTTNPTANSTTGNSQQQSSGTTEKSTINLGSSTIFPVGGAPKVQVTSQGNKVIRLQTVAGTGGQRMIVPRSAGATVLQTRATRPITPATTQSNVLPNTSTTSTGSAASGPRTPGQHIQIIRLPDGQLQVRGLLEGQQLLQRSDGKFQLINKSQLPVNSSQAPATSTTSSPAIQVTQQTKTIQPSPTTTVANVAVSPKVNSTATTSTANTQISNTAGSHVVKVNGMQVLVKQLAEPKQVVTVGASEAASGTAAATTSSANSLKPGGLVTPGGQTSPRIKTMLTADGTMVKTVMSTVSSTSTVSTATTTAANSTCTTTTAASGESPTSAASQNNNNNNPANSGNSLTLKVQVRMTEQGPKTIIHGLQPGVGLTKDHILAIQQQVRNMLAQYNLQVNQLSPVMNLTLHVPNKQQAQPQPPTPTRQEQPTNESKEEPKKLPPPQPEPQVQKQEQKTVNTAAFRSLLSPQSQVASQSPAVIAVKNASAEPANLGIGAEAGESTDQPPVTSQNNGDDAAKAAKDEFVLNQEYIQQTIKSVLRRGDLNPEVEEKIMQLQKYSIEQTKKDEPPDSVGTTPSSTPVNNSSRNSAVKRLRVQQDDTDWDPGEEKTPNIVTVAPPKPRPKKSRSESRQTDSSKPKKSSAKTEALDLKKKQALQNKLESLMTRHKDFLKKDILKKRAQLEKELQVEIHKELSVARLQLQMLEKSKTESSLSSPVISPRKKKISESSPSQIVPAGANQLLPEATRLTQTAISSQNSISSNKSSSLSKSPNSKTSSKSSSAKKAAKNKNKKIVCICRTPFDDTKFYVGCDLCGNWFHGDCVGITEAMSRSMTEYVCDDCANAKLNKELFCFCRQPYDETQFYICCEQCEDWYHGKCVGIMQSEADDIDDYICPKCDSNNAWNYPCQKALSNKDYVELKKLSKGLIQHKNAWPFLEPVDPSEVPDYYRVVKEPMDLKTVESRVENKSYPRLAQFIGDVMLVFDNCRLYNPPNSSFCSCAATLETFFCQKLKSLKSRLSQR